MKVGIVGAGPAGLYLAILLARADEAHDITVVERNPADATYGWGVVFSEETLTELRDADYTTWLDLDEHLVRWSAIDIHLGDQQLRSVGHGFSAVARLRLLSLLQRRAAELGVDLRFQTEVDEPEAYFADADVIVGADGIRSTVRDRHAETFGTTAEPRASKYVWFGTDLVFEVFTFIFRDTEHGLFTVHGYPFDGRTSTFIVETSEETWRAAGLDRMSEQESLAFCQALFADHLGDHKLLSNKSEWTSFTTVRNRSWHHGKLVLVGDAAHTAHFSIGSGTKLAMEDAIALSKAFTEHPHDLQAAFSGYELERQVPVERFQLAADDSATYFEHVARYLHFDLEQFAFNLLTRSGRITRANLELRDPATVRRVEAWYQAQATGADRDATRVVTAPARLAPLSLRGLALANRIVLAPPAPDTAEDGTPGESHAATLAAAAVAGAALVVTERVAVSAHGRITTGSAGLYHDRHVGAWADIVSALQAAGARVAVRLTHAGRRGACRPRQRGLDRPLSRGAWLLLAPSPIPYTTRSQTPHDLAEKADDVVEDFAWATRAAAEAGFDVAVVDCADGYLLASCLSPLSNRRSDDWGGALGNRLRFPLRVVDAVRESWPADRPLAVRLNADDRVSGGFTPAEAVAVAAELAGHGVDLVDVAAGHTVPAGAAAADYRRGYLVDYSTTVRNEAGVATVTSGRISTLDEADTILAAGRADLVVLDPNVYRR